MADKKDKRDNIVEQADTCIYKHTDQQAGRYAQKQTSRNRATYLDSHRKLNDRQIDRQK